MTSPLKTIQDVAIDTAKEYGEPILDHILKLPMVKEIPVISTTINLFRTFKSIQDLILIKQIAKFFYEFNSCSQEELDRFLSSLKKDPKQAEKIWETILLILRRSDEMDKSALIGKVFKAYLKHLISLDEFKRLSKTINDCSFEALSKLVEVYEVLTKQEKSQKFTGTIDQKITDEYETLDKFILQDLFLAGLVKTPGATYGDWPLYETTTLGTKLVDIINLS